MNNRIRNMLKSIPLVRSAVRFVRAKLCSVWYQAMGLGYTQRRIAAGPNRGLFFSAGKRVRYSKDFWNGTYESDACHFLENIIWPDAICYDIGANLGYHALIMARKATKGFVYAFEPLQEAGLVLENNITVNQIRNIQWVAKAVTAQSGQVKLGRNVSIDQAAVRWADDEDPMYQAIECESMSLDDFVNSGSPAPSFIKIDVEGAETDVLLGAKGTLAQYKPMILCETHGIEAATRVYEILCAQGYELFTLGANLSPIRSLAEMPTNMYEGHVLARAK